MKVPAVGVLLCFYACIIKTSYGVAFPGYDGRTPQGVALDQGGGIWEINFKIVYPSTYAYPPLSVRAVDQSNNNALSTDADCVNNTLVDEGGGLSSLTVTFDVNTTDIAGSPCFVQSRSPSGVKLKFQTFITLDASTPGDYSVYFDLEIPAADVTVWASGNYVYDLPTTPAPTDPPVLPVSLTEPTITATFKIMKNSAVINTNDVGEPFYLQLEMQINPYKADVDVAGAIIHTCRVASDSGMTQDVHQFIGTDSCFDASALVFKTSASNVGFARIAGSSGTTGTSPNIVKKYTAESMLLEASAIADGSLSVSTDWYFECTLTICYDDSTGQCGGQHCAPAIRKKRAVPRADAVVRTKLTINPESLGKQVPCAETVTFKATVGTLGTTIIVLFFGIIFSYTSYERAKKKQQARKSGYVSSRTSQLTLEESLSSCSSDRKSMKC